MFDNIARYATCTLIAHADARGAFAHRVEQARRLAAEPGILPFLAVAADDIMSGLDFREQLRDFLRRILQVGVERHDHLAARALERRHDRHVLAEIAVEVDDAHLLRPLCVKILEQHERVVTAAIVGEEDFERLADLVEHRGQAQEQRRQVFLLVVYRNHDAHIRLGHVTSFRTNRPWRRRRSWSVSPAGEQRQVTRSPMLSAFGKSPGLKPSVQ
jgi:hypothetical protein